MESNRDVNRDQGTSTSMDPDTRQLVTQTRELSLAIPGSHVSLPSVTDARLSPSESSPNSPEPSPPLSISHDFAMDISTVGDETSWPTDAQPPRPAQTYRTSPPTTSSRSDARDALDAGDGGLGASSPLHQASSQREEICHDDPSEGLYHPTQTAADQPFRTPAVVPRFAHASTIAEAYRSLWPSPPHLPEGEFEGVRGGSSGSLWTVANASATDAAMSSPSAVMRLQRICGLSWHRTGPMNLDVLPNEVLMHILGFLEVCDLLATSRTNHHLRALSLHPILHFYRLRRTRLSLPSLLISPTRPTLRDLTARHIFLTNTSQISRRLARNLIAIRLSRRLPLRPSAETLVQRGVLPGECVEGSVAPGLVARKRAVERERLKDGLRRWVGGVWKGEVRERGEGVKRFQEVRGVGRVWKLKRFWEHVGQEDDR
ncbi:hypothetical protein BX600DRAFT_517557 [Xylariales sp. PMI_506]|nr:hypothetical protein BX600DRAFT_517557 [Xylariales sp. PMI_506]